MKRFFRFVMAAAVIFSAVSCAKEDISSTIGGGEVEVTFTANLAGLGTRAIADGNTVDCVYLAIFDANNDAYLSELTVDAGYPVSNGQATIPVVLLKDKKYDLVFWAQKDGTGAYTLDLEHRQVKANYGAAANNEARDAFFNISNDWTAGKDATTFELRRPFAQINVGNSDADVKYAKQNGSVISQSAMTVTTEVYDTIELVNGSLTGTKVSAEFTLAAIPTETVKGTVDPTHDALLNASEEYNYLAMNYLLVNDRQLVDLVFNFTDGTTTFERKYYQVPVQRNYRTNILGQIISSPMDFTVEIKPGFDGEYNDVWDGQTVAAPAYDDATKTYTIVKPSELAWLAAAVNGTLETRAVAADSFMGKTFVLTKDIDLGYKEWTPIGNDPNNFQGTFDGNGKTISSLYINTPSESNVGLFGMTTNGEIKNLTVKNAKVTGYLNVGVVAGTPYTSKYTNITVTGLIEVNGMAYVGAVGGKNAYADWTNINVNAAEGSYVYADSREDGKAYRTYVGGVVGFNGEGGHSFKNITSNINVEGSTCDVGGLFGIAHYGNKFENCSCSGDVTIAEANEEIGGIAGVWNNGGADVVMTNCSFTGNLIATTGELTVWYGGLVGKPYSASGTGKLIIDGLAFDVNGVIFEAINEALASGNGYTLPFDLKGAAAASNAYGATGLTQINGGILDGNNCTLKVTKAGGTWDSAINTTGGTIKNITVAQGFRGIFVNHNSTNYGKVYLDNVTIDGPVYTISCDQGTNSGLEAVNSTFNGWTSYAATIGNVTFTNCEFGEGSGYKFCRPYAPTTFVRCNFCEGFKIDARANVVLVDCTVGDVDVTADNIATLVTSNTANASLAPVVENQADLTETLASATYVKVAAGEYTFPASIKAGATIECAEGTVFTGNSKLNINGATVIGAKFSNPTGSAVDQTINGTFKNCTFEGSNGLRYCYAGETVVFEDCVFSGSLYGIHFDGGANDVIFRNCTISGFNALGGALALVTFENCTFVGNGKSGYNGANLWGSAKLVKCEFTFDGTTGTEWIDCIGADKTYEFENCTINGVAYTAENYKSYDDIFSRNNVTVKINGVDCAM